MDLYLILKANIYVKRKIHFKILPLLTSSIFMLFVIVLFKYVHACMKLSYIYFNYTALDSLIELKIRRIWNDTEANDKVTFE